MFVHHRLVRNSGSFFHVALFAAFLFSVTACDRPAQSADDGDTTQSADARQVQEIPEIRLGGPALGTTYNIRIRLEPDSAAAARLAENTNITALLERDIQREFAAINAAMSNWQADSEISRFNQSRSTAPVQISPPFMRVLREAQRVHQISGGAFDPAKDTLFALWGFGGGQTAPGDATSEPTHPPAAPTDAEIAAVQSSSGMARLKIFARRNQIQKTAPELRLNLSAIAKGDAVDRIFHLIEQHKLLRDESQSGHGGRPAVMVEVGGEVRVGRTAGGRAWQLGIERPEYTAGRRSLYKVAELENRSMATSGDYRNYYTLGGVRYTHILDPRTGRPEKTGVAQATVIGPECMTADALATTLLVLGEKDGLRLLETQAGYEALLLVAEGDGFRAAATPGMAAYLRR